MRVPQKVRQGVGEAEKHPGAATKLHVCTSIIEKLGSTPQ